MVSRKKHRNAVTLAALASVTGASTVWAGSPYATSIVAQSAAGTFGGAALYNDPLAVLGEPTRIAKNNDPIIGTSPFHVKIVEPAYNRDYATNAKVITTLARKAGSGPGGYDYGSITVAFDHDIVDDPTNPYGVDLNVFGNAFYVGSGYVSDTEDMRGYSLVGGIFAEPVVISVSPDNVNWYTYSNGPYGDTDFPTQGHAWSPQQHDATGNGWTGQPATDFTKPVNPTLTSLLGVEGVTVSTYDAMQTYVNSGGGTGIDLAPSGFASIKYVRVESTAQYRDGEIDGFADVRPMQVGEALSITPESVTDHTSLFFKSNADTTRTAIRADFTSVSDRAKLSTATYSDAPTLSLITTGEVLGAYSLDVSNLIVGGSAITFAANLSLLPGLNYSGDGSDLSVLSWNGSAWTPIASTFDASSGLAKVAGYSNASGVLALRVSAYTYAIDANGVYSTAGAFAWSGNVPTTNNGRLVFGSAITAARTVTIDQPLALTSLTFNNTNSYTLAGSPANAITLGGPSPVVTVRAGNHTIASPVVLASNARFDIAANSVLSLTGTLNGAGKDLAKVGAGTLTLPASQFNAVSVINGKLAASGTGETLAHSVTIDAGAIYDVGRSALVIDYASGGSPLDQLKTYISDGRVTSDQLALGSTRAIGYLDTSAFPSLTSFGGTPIDATTLILAATLKGDVNLDKSVNFSDLLALAQNYGGTAKQWYHGDFNYDGAVNFNDLLALAQNYGGNALAAEAVNILGSDFSADFVLAQSLVPEPATIAMLAGCGIITARRRRHRSA